VKEELKRYGHLTVQEALERARADGVAAERARWEARLERLRARSKEMHNNPSYLRALAIMSGIDEEGP
jgi:hypothetical protein